MVAQRHLEDTLGNAAVCNAPYGDSLLLLDKLLNSPEYLLNAVEYRQAVFVVFRRDVAYLAVRALEFRGNNILRLCGGNCKGNESRGNVDMLECAAHAVLAADGAAAHLKLCLICAEQCRKRLAPALGLALCSLEVFLECQPALLAGAARSDYLRDALNYRAYRAVVG